MMATESIMLTGSGAFTIPIFMIRFTGIPGTMIPISTIPSITHPGIIRHGPMPGTGDGDTAGIHPTTAMDGGIPHTTATGTAPIIPLIMVGDIRTIHGTDKATTGTQIPMNTIMAEGDQPVPMPCMEVITAEEHRLHPFAPHQPAETETLSVPEEAVLHLN